MFVIESLLQNLAMFSTCDQAWLLRSNERFGVVCHAFFFAGPALACHPTPMEAEDFVGKRRPGFGFSNARSRRANVDRGERPQPQRTRECLRAGVRQRPTDEGRSIPDPPAA
jgi:hypothetical protein